MTNFTPLACHKEAQQMAKSSPESKQENLEMILASLHRMALIVLELPKSDREAIYEDVRASLADMRQALNLSDKEMADFEDSYMTWLRAMVDMIEHGGGAQGGKA
jgi:hypothetical protein